MTPLGPPRCGRSSRFPRPTGIHRFDCTVSPEPVPCIGNRVREPPPGRAERELLPGSWTEKFGTADQAVPRPVAATGSRRHGSTGSGAGYRYHRVPRRGSETASVAGEGSVRSADPLRTRSIRHRRGIWPMRACRRQCTSTSAGHDTGSRRRSGPEPGAVPGSGLGRPGARFDGPTIGDRFDTVFRHPNRRGQRRAWPSSAARSRSCAPSRATTTRSHTWA